MLILLIASISFLGVILLGILFLLIKQNTEYLKLKKFRSKNQSFTDLLNYAGVVEDGVIVNKNGSFMAGFIYRGTDNESATIEDRNMISFRINQALSGLGNGWMLHCDSTRIPSEKYSDEKLSNFPDIVSKAIDDERRQFFENRGETFESTFTFVITWFPPILAQQKFVELMFDDDKEKLTDTQRTEGLITKFTQEVANIEARLSIPLKLTRLKGHAIETEFGENVIQDDFLSWLQFCVNGIRQKILLPSNPMYLDAVIGGQDFWGGVIPRIGNKYIQTISIDGFPSVSIPGLLTSLGELSCEYRWSTRFIFLDQHEALGAYEKYRKKWKQKVRGFIDQMFNTASGKVNQDAMDMVDDADSAIKSINSGNVSAGYYTSTVVLFDEDRNNLDKNAQYILKAIRGLGFSARLETINNLEAFLGSLPGHGVENIRRPLINTLNLADLLPTSSIWTGLDHAPCPFYPPLSPPLMYCVAKGGTPFRLNLHVRDVGHTLVIGPTGSGKSTLLAILVAQFRRYENMSIFVFDKGMSMFALTEACGGDHYEIGDEGGLSFAPFEFLETKNQRDKLLIWVEDLLVLNKIDITPERTNLIEEAIQSMHKTGSTSLSEFTYLIQDQQIREALQAYTVGHTMGNLLDADVDQLKISKFATFEIETLMQLPEKYAIPVLLYLFNRIESSLKGQPAIIVLDEAWLMLGNERFREKIREWLKVLRKANCIVILATQNISDASNSGILDVITESTPTKIFLPNRYARLEDATIMYKKMGLNSKQIELIASAIPQREYYYSSELGQRKFSLALSQLALAFVGVSDKEEVSFIKELIAQHKELWVEKWLSIKGLIKNEI